MLGVSPSQEQGLMTQTFLISNFDHKLQRFFLSSTHVEASLQGWSNKYNSCGDLPGFFLQLFASNQGTLYIGSGLKSQEGQLTSSSAKGSNKMNSVGLSNIIFQMFCSFQQISCCNVTVQRNLHLCDASNFPVEQ